MNGIIATTLLFSFLPAAPASGAGNPAFLALTGLSSIEAPGAPAPQFYPTRRPSQPEAWWITAVKRAYRAAPTGTLPPAAKEELPAQALQQMQWDAATYPSRAYKIVIDGRAAFVIENDNLEALYVNIFDEAGAHIAYGGFDENYDFYWLSKS